MLKKIVFIGTTIAIAPYTHADALGFSIGAYQWQQNIDGSVRSGGENVDLHDDLGFGRQHNNVYFAEFDHPVPVLPNVRLQHTEMSSSETSTLTRTITVDDVTYSASSAVRTDLDLSHTDATFYYRPLDNWVKLRAGLTLRNFDKGVKIRSLSTGDTAKVDISSVIPMLYLAARFDLPLTGLYIGADANGIAYSGSHLFDSRINAGYETPIGIGIEGGYRRFELKYDHSGDHADVTVDGVYAEVFYHF
jgi:outer membrane protein